ncbi:ATP-binding protein [Neobacillus sp. 3P2-tot-E-2]|uniref:AAA family ATPase n=1 Tax=Neobacillus sp. 3P2-tot-E-2 TaxID=3132212 RepID=UPI00399EF53B
MQIQTKLKGAERNFFVGRAKELEILHKHTTGNSECQWLHINGQSGIGKSTLLQQFMAELEVGEVYFLDGSKTIRAKEDVFVQLANQLKSAGEWDLHEQNQEEIVNRIIHRSAQKGGHVVLLLDTFENWHTVEKWLPQWLGQFEDTVRIITAGRHPLTGGWLRSGWASFLHSVPLTSLTPTDVDQYARKRGLASNETKSQLFQFSRGIPLAMTLVAEMMLKGNQYKPLARIEQNQLISVLIEELFDGLDASVRRLLEAASVFWRFNEERLSSLLEEEIDYESFRRLIKMPFIILKEDGWMLHDAIRSWALEDMMLRKPQTYEQMRLKALKQIRLEERSNPLLRQKLQLDKMSLHENPLVRNICFTGHLDNVEVRGCHECDLPVIESLYIRYHHFVLPEASEDILMVRLIRPIWEVDPSSFITIWQENELVAFFGKIPLHDKMLKVLETDQVLHPFLKGWKPAPNSYLICFVGLEPELAAKTQTYVISTLINHFSLSKWLLDFTCLKEWFPVLELCGFDSAPWSYGKTQSGTEFRGFILDLTQEDYLSKLDRVLSKNSLDETLNQPKSTGDVNELKILMKEFSKIPGNSGLSETYTRLFPHRITFDLSTETIGKFIQKDIVDVINLLIGGEEMEATLGRILKYAFIQGIRPHELVAKKTNLSLSTYYRYLNKALERLFQDLAQKNL